MRRKRNFSIQAKMKKKILTNNIIERGGIVKPTQRQLNYAKDISNRLGFPIPNETDINSVNQYIQTHKDNYFRAKTQDIKSHIKIDDYAKELGFTVERKGRYLSLKEHDSVIIDPQKNCFWRNSEAGQGHSIGKGGSVIDFALEFTNQSLRDILDDFNRRVSGIDFTGPENRISPQERNTNNIEKRTEITLPEKGQNMRRVYAYLVQSRFIDPDVVQDFVNKKMLYQDHRGNCVFVSREGGKPVFASFRGTLTDRRFLGDVEGSDYSKGFLINNQAAQTVVTESVIDTMSVMSVMKAKGENLNDYNYMPLSGNVKVEALLNHIENDNVKKVILAVDNDSGGQKSIEAIKGQCKTPGVDFVEALPDAKDWNEEISTAFRKCVPLKKLNLGFGVPEVNLSGQKAEVRAPAEQRGDRSYEIGSER